MSTPTVTSKIIPGRAAPLPQAATAASRTRNVPVEIDDNVIARPLTQPGEEIILKDKSMEARWVNYAVGEKQSTLRFSQMKAAGYVVCKPDEVEKGLEFMEIMPDGRVMNGDCILMKIKKALIDGAKKFNWERAQRRRGRNITRDAQEAVRADLRASGAAASQLKKISTFVPNEAELGALVGTDKDSKP